MKTRERVLIRQSGWAPKPILTPKIKAGYKNQSSPDGLTIKLRYKKQGIYTEFSQKRKTTGSGHSEALKVQREGGGIS
jgi:hypothetical protein